MTGFNDVIAAIATAVSEAGISIIRISGEGAVELADSVYRFGSKRLTDAASHTIHYGYAVDGEQVIDECLFMVMRGPKSFTGEDTVEIDCHGGVFVTKRVLETVLKAGARIAEPGEFTKRAFLNGRLDLSQAEAVTDVITSRNTYALHSSIDQLKGSLSVKVRELREQIIYQMAFIESALDDPEHISLEGYPEQLLEVVTKLEKEMVRLISSYQNGRLRREGIKTVLVGKPNAGKSSLLNAFMGEERAIVTEIAGTTRDTLEENINIGGISLNLVDTAGIRETGNVVEKIGVERALKFLDEADLALYVVDSSVPLDESDREIIEKIKEKKTIVLLNKSDLKAAFDLAQLQAMMNHAAGKTTEDPEHTETPVIRISALEGSGIDEFEALLKEMFFSGDLAYNDEVVITNVRHKMAMEEALESIRKVQESIELCMPEDFFSIDLAAAYGKLGEVIGEEVGEDLVNEIFSRFCTGK